MRLVGEVELMIRFMQLLFLSQSVFSSCYVLFSLATFSDDIVLIDFIRFVYSFGSEISITMTSILA